MDIDEKIYRTNGFRILGLDITSKNRKIDNRMSKIDRFRQRNDFKDNDPLKGVFDKANIDFLLPVSPEPSYNEYQVAKNRLTDVETRLIDEIFWFWPKSFDTDLDEEIVKYLKENKYGKAISYWGDVSTSNTMNMTSIHNLAVLYHVRALDGFIEGKGNKKLFEDLSFALNYWHQTLNSNDFKNYVKQRVNIINDPRLTEEFVDEIFDNLPRNLLNMNVIFIKKLLDSEYVGKRKLDYVYKYIYSIQNSPFDSSVISIVFSKIINIIENLIDENKKSFNDSFETIEDTDEKFNLIFEYCDKILPYLSILNKSFENDNIANNLLNSNCIFIYNKIPTAMNLLFIKIVDEINFNKFLELLKTLNEYTTDAELKNTISSDLDTLNSVGGIGGQQKTPNMKSKTSFGISTKDQDQNNLSDVKVTFTNLNTNKSYECTSNYVGYCELNDLPYGEYSYKATKKDYVDYEGTISIGDNSDSVVIQLVSSKPKISTSDIDVMVRDSKGNTLIADVNFINSETSKKYSGTTNFSGSCTLTDLPQGNYRFEIEKLGYKKYTGTKIIREGSNSIYVNLKEESSSTPASSYNKKFFILVSTIILLSLLFYVAINFI